MYVNNSPSSSIFIYIYIYINNSGAFTKSLNDKKGSWLRQMEMLDEILKDQLEHKPDKLKIYRLALNSIHDSCDKEEQAVNMKLIFFDLIRKKKHIIEDPKEGNTFGEVIVMDADDNIHSIYSKPMKPFRENCVYFNGNEEDAFMSIVLSIHKKRNYAIILNRIGDIVRTRHIEYLKNI